MGMNSEAVMTLVTGLGFLPGNLIAPAIEATNAVYGATGDNLSNSGTFMLRLQGCAQPCGHAYDNIPQNTSCVKTGFL